MKKRYILSVVLLFSVMGTSCSLFAKKITSKPIAISEKKVKSKVQKEKVESRSIDEMLKHTAETQGVSWKLLLLVFFAGILISFTPCIYPMIPITIGVLKLQESHSFFRSLFSAITYVLGISVVYASLGYFSATAGVLFGRWMASPFVIGFVVLFFLYLAFSMFGFYEIHVPKFLSKRGEVKTKGSLLKIFIFGMISGTVASPCLTPALAVLLAVVAKLGNPFVGLLILFVFSIGMGLPLVLIGTFSGALTMLPRAGEWMLEVNRAMGFMLLGVCVYFMQPFIGYQFVLLLYGFILLASSRYFYQQRTRGIAMWIISILLIVGAIVVIYQSLSRFLGFSF